jgi:hypothetical protein
MRLHGKHRAHALLDVLKNHLEKSKKFRTSSRP